MFSGQTMLALLRRPSLWAEGIRSLLAVAPRRWWRKPPFIPRPDPSYMSWRVATAHGDADSILTAQELIAYLEWRKRQHKVLRRI